MDLFEGSEDLPVLDLSLNNQAAINQHALPSGLKPKLDLIFSEVEKKLPDIDFELSDVDSDSEEPIIFHQNLKSVVIEEDKDLDTSLSGDSLLDLSFTQNEKKPFSDPPSIPLYDNDLAYELQLGSGPVKSWSDIPIDAKDNNSLNLLHEALQENQNRSNKVSSWSAIPQDNQQQVGENDTQPLQNNMGDVCFLSLNALDDKGIQKQLDREQKRSKAKEMATSILSPRGPLLSTHALDNIDLDALLQNFDTEGDEPEQPQPRQAWSSTTAEKNKANAGTKGDEGMTLIQRLAQLSMDRYGEDLTDVDPSTGAKVKENVPDNDAAIGVYGEPVNNNADDVDEESEVITQNKTSLLKGAGENAASKPAKKEQQKKSVSSCGTSTSDLSKPPKILTARKPPLPPATPPVTQPISKDKPALKGDKEPTVFIDLRNFEQIRQEQQKNIERVQQVLGIKSEQSVSSPMHNVSDNDDEEDVEDWRQQRQKYKQMGTSRSERRVYRDGPIRHVQPQRVIPNADMILRNNRSNEIQQTPATRSQQEMEQVRKQLLEEREKDKRQEIIRKLREQKESERQAKLRLQRRLDALRPSASVHGKNDPAENTPTLFDMEASYESAPRSLPPVLAPETDCVLLTINLSSNGEIVLHKGKSVDTGKGLSASYTTLITWLLALVPQDYTYLQETSASAQVTPWILPFYVIGLQQVLLDEQLCLMVAVTPVEQFDSKYVPKNKKSKKSEGKAFTQHLVKYFTTNTLHSVCPWLQNMVSMEVGAAQSESGYAYKPPLPNITKKPLSTFIQISQDPQAASKVFNTAVGFFWQTVDSDEQMLDQELHNKDVTYDTQNTISLIYKKIYQDPAAMMGILNRALQLGLDLSGIRLVYPTPEQMNLPKTDNASALSELDLLNNVGAVLSLCIRGTSARSLWLDAVGPSDPVLARKTDPNSLCALYGGDSRDECLLFSPRTPIRVLTELARWFGGRVPPGNVIDVGIPYTRKDNLRSGSPKGKRTKTVTFAENAETVEPETHRPLATLTATSKSEIFLILSPLVPPKCYGIVIASCQRRGFQIVGIKRCRLSSKRASVLGITGDSIKAFCRGSALEVYDEILSGHVQYHHKHGQHEAEFPSTILQLQKENASHSAASLIEDCMVQLSLQGIMGTLQKREGFPIESQHMLHAARYSDNLLTALGGEFSRCFDPEIQINPNYVIPKLYTNPEMEQVTVLILLGHDILKTSGLFVGKILNMIPYSKSQPALPFAEGLELLGMKWIPSLSTSQAKEVTPFEVGDRQWKESLHTLMNEPCMVFALRGVDAFEKLWKIIPPRPRTMKQDSSPHQDLLHARNAEEAYTFIRVFFTERELFSDPLSRPMLPYIPKFTSQNVEEMPSESKKKTAAQQTYPYEESVFDIMLSGPRPFATFLVIKPRAFKRHLTKILKKLAQEGFKIVGLKLLVLDEENAMHIAPNDVEEDAKAKHLQYLTSGPCLCLSVQRENAVKKLLDLLGPEDSMSARRQSQFYWRGVFGIDSVCNGIFASKSYKDAMDHQRIFFPDGLCCEELDILAAEQIPCPAVDEEINLNHSTERRVQIQPSRKSDSTDSTHGLLQQTTCIVLTPLLMKKFGAHFGYVEVIEGLVSQGFGFAGARMVYFDHDQAEHFLCLIDAGNFQMVPLLMSGPSIVLALHRDNAVLAFDTILRESFSTETEQGRSVTDSLLHKYGRMILRPSDMKQANNLLGYFFNKLLPDADLEITTDLS